MIAPSLASGFLLAAVVLAGSAAACAVARVVLENSGVVDIPNSRSSHARPVPRGGGIGFVAVILFAWAGLWFIGGSGITLSVLVGATAIALISFVDDVRRVSIAVRLAIQSAAIIGALASVSPDTALLSDALPFGVDRLVAGLAWLWFVNLFNFMDGIDGIAASEAVVISAGIVVVGIVQPGLGLPIAEAIVVGAAVLAFLPFNWPPAKVFMGDAGSATLGYVLGWLLLTTAAAGAMVPAVLLPLYFAADATSTLGYRLSQRRPVSEAHRDHAYQRGVDRGLSHTRVTSIVIVVGIVLIALSVLGLSTPLVALGSGLALTAAAIAWLRYARPSG